MRTALPNNLQGLDPIAAAECGQFSQNWSVLSTSPMRDNSFSGPVHSIVISAKYGSALVFISVVALCIQLFLQRTGSQTRIPPRLAQRIHPILKRLHARGQKESEEGDASSDRVETANASQAGTVKEGAAEQMYTAHTYAVLLLSVTSFLLFVTIFVF